MPQLIIKGVSAQQTQQLAPKMIEVVSRLVGVPGRLGHRRAVRIEIFQ